MAVTAEEFEEDNPRSVLDSVVIRFAGDSGDGMQLTGNQFTLATALAGNDLATFPDFPAEIRAPVGTTFGVSAFQINFGASGIRTSGDMLDVLVAMNPAALKVNADDLRVGGLAIVDTGSFSKRNLDKAGYAENPLTDGSLEKYKVLEIDMSRLTRESVKELGLSAKDGLRCKNMWSLGLIYWMFGRKRKPTVDWLKTKFKKLPVIADANIAALNAGHAFGETAEMPAEVTAYTIPPADIQPGLYRTVTGAEAIAWGLVAGSQLAELEMVFCSYPITPASSVLHYLANMNEYGVLTFQAEDEISAACAAIGVSYGGSLGVTSSSGPGVALKTEAIGLAISVELPLVVVNSQRAGPSTGLPTKTEQSDLYQAVYGRNADSPIAVLASRSPGDCFDTAVEAVRLATKYMTPVMLLTDGYMANASEPWLIPDFETYEPFPAKFRDDPEDFHPYLRDPDSLGRVWVKPGTPGLEHRVGGIEKSYDSGHISYDPANHQKMTDVRAAKIDGIANDIPAQAVASGEDSGKLAVVGWGSTFGAINQAVGRCVKDGLSVSHIHIRHVWPFPANLGELLSKFDRIIVPEMNNGQMVNVLRAKFLVDAESITQITGQPFKVSTLEREIRSRIEG